MLIGLLFLLNGTAIAGELLPPTPVDSQAGAPTDGNPSAFKKRFSHLETEFILSAGLRRDALEWSIARDAAGNNPNVLSELKWSGVDSYQLSLANRSYYRRHLYLRGHVNYALIRDGRVRDSDYGLDDRRGEWSRSISETNGDELWDVLAGGGYSFYFVDDRLTVAPMVGFSYHKQNLRIQNGVQVLSEDNPFSSSPDNDPPPVGPLSSDLNSTYFARWMGPWIGCDLRYAVKDRGSAYPPVDLGFSLELHWADYYGQGNWNLRSDLEHPKSFEHEAIGFGLKFSADMVVHLANQWDVTIAFNYLDWSTLDGTNRVFSADSGSYETQLNEVNWNSSSIMIGAVCHF